MRACNAAAGEGGDSTSAPAARRIGALQRRLNAPAGYDLGTIPSKPPDMHRSTYGREARVRAIMERATAS